MNEILISSDDAKVLSTLIGGAAQSSADDAAETLADALDYAEVVATAQLPPSVVAMNTTIDYVEIPNNKARTVVLVHPAQADAKLGRVSVLSPVGQALLGRRVGSVSEVRLPAGNSLAIRIVGASAGAADG
jgi:regulator of nucleoside diphosphate kinase